MGDMVPLKNDIMEDTMPKIAVIGGDGTGPEVIQEGLKCLRCVSELWRIPFQFEELPIDGKRYVASGDLLTDADIQNLSACDAIYLGAIGHPDIQPGVLERGILLKLRVDLDQFINYRPVKLYPNVETPIKGVSSETIDYVVIRENTGGLYTGVGGVEHEGMPNEVASQVMIYTKKQVQRCIEFAFETAIKRHQHQPWRGLTADQLADGKVGKVTLCGKTNVLLHVFGLWQRVMDAVSIKYPTIVTDYTHVDAVCVHMIERPEIFDVIVTSNMFGDIITDLAAVTMGGMGVAASANINPSGVSMFEPIGGTAPAFTGKNVINPMAAIGAAHLMLAAMGFEAPATDLETAKVAVIQKMASMQAGKMGFKTDEIGNMVCDELNRMPRS